MLKHKANYKKKLSLKVQHECKYITYGFALAVQYWRYEAILEIGKRYDTNHGIQFSRMLNWTSKGEIGKKELNALFSRRQLEVMKRLLPRPDKDEYHYYQLDSHPKLVAISIAEMAEKYKTRKNIRLQHFREYYKNPEDFENAVKNPPNELNEDQWRLICELFTTPDFIQRSKQNSINRQKMKFSSTTGSVTMAEILRQKQGKGYIETWKECHTKKDTNTFFINEICQK
ncbi:uncharacterized protein LOC133037121 [Cannabis sativa]|uniref:uncharacterized protein LOC133037121 n=1 Tax=Cannabis sativa TaxID=3483 RepID=UPI0029C9F784|nr:uncharacterized protein LOC133037121 [Cannabis sativa]